MGRHHRPGWEDRIGQRLPVDYARHLFDRLHVWEAHTDLPIRRQRTERLVPVPAVAP